MNGHFKFVSALYVQRTCVCTYYTVKQSSAIAYLV